MWCVKTNPLHWDLTHGQVVCSPQPLSAEDTDSEDGCEGLALVGGCTLQKQGCAGHKAGGVLERLRPHTGWAQAKAGACLSGSPQARRAGLAVPLKATRCVGNTAGLWKSPAQSVSFSLHSYCPQGLVRPAQVLPTLSKDGPTPTG